jgi:hypothetical protein
MNNILSNKIHHILFISALALIVNMSIIHNSQAVTMVGTQNAFIDALKDLLELDYDVIEAYNVSIDKIKNRDQRKKLIEFRNEYQKDTKELNNLIKELGDQPPKGPSTKQYLTKGKVYLANVISDKSILAAMRDNEDDADAAVERVSTHKDKIAQSSDFLNRRQQHSRKHLEWLDRTVKRM